MGKKSGPPAPDYTAIANTQGQQSKENTTEQTWANRPDQTSPFGNITWSSAQTKDPTTGQAVTKWTQNTTLDPELQNALNSQTALTQGRSDLANSMLGGVQQTMGTPMDYGQFGPMGQAPQGGNNAFNFGPQGQVQQGLDLSGNQALSSAADARAAAEKATYGSLTSRLDPQYAQQQRDLETQLANKGISSNSDAYTSAMDSFNRGKNDAYANANMAAVNAGGNAAQQNYGMDLSTRQQQTNEAALGGNFANNAQAQMFGQNQSAGQAGLQQQAQNFGQQTQTANYQNQLRQQQIAEALQQRGMGLNEMNALLGGQQVTSPQFQNFGQAGVAQTPDLLGAANSQNAAAQNAQSSSNAATGQTLGALASMAAMFFSDQRVKTDIRRIGQHPRGFGIYAYRYVGERGRRVGVLAQEVRRFMPQAVAVNSGVLMVDYSQLGGLAA